MNVFSEEIWQLLDVHTAFFLSTAVVISDEERAEVGVGDPGDRDGDGPWMQCHSSCHREPRTGSSQFGSRIDRCVVDR